MPNEDAARWDARYKDEERYSSFNQARLLLVDHSALLPERGLALDLAMGPGGNAAFLLENGLRVIGVDISMIALRRAKERLPQLMAVQADLNHFVLPRARFDLILNFFYLQRSLFSPLVEALRLGGLLFFETLLEPIRADRPDIDPAFLLAPGELGSTFPSLETIFYQEGWQESRTGRLRPVASLIARKPL